MINKLHSAVLVFLLSAFATAEECPSLNKIFKNEWPTTTEGKWKPMSKKDWEDKWIKPICHLHICNGDLVSFKGVEAALSKPDTWKVYVDNFEDIDHAIVINLATNVYLSDKTKKLIASQYSFFR
jgi:hypothetical protein